MSILRIITRPFMSVRAHEVILAGLFGAMVVGCATHINAWQGRGHLIVSPQSQRAYPAQRRPITVTFSLRNGGRSPLHILGVSGG